MRNTRSTLLTIAILLTAMSMYAQDANAILSKVDDVMFSPKDMSGKTKIVLIDKNGKEKTREAIMVQKGTDKRIFRFTAPASQDGIAVLSLPDDVMYLYLPAYGKERRISTSVKSQNFAGTDFSYDDMEAKPNSEKYTPKLIEARGDVFVLELTPKSPKSPYSKIVMEVHATHYYPVSGDYYDKSGKVIKEATSNYVKIGDYWNAQEMVMTDLKKNHTTRMIMSDVKYDQNLSDDEFTIRKLKQ